MDMVNNNQQLLNQLAKKLNIKPENIACILKLDNEYAVTYGESVYVINNNQINEYLAYEPEGSFYLMNGDIIYQKEKFDNDNWETIDNYL